MKLGVRSSGVLLHPTSLPGPVGAGDIGPAAHRFAETLKAFGQSWWQMLPVVPPGAGDSPYSAFSAFAGSPQLISLESLVEQGLLDKEDFAGPKNATQHADFVAAERFKRPRLVKAFKAFRAQAGPQARRQFEEFRERNAAWLEDYVLFEALRETYPPGVWTQWDRSLRVRDASTLRAARERLEEDIRFQTFLQFAFDQQWRELRRRCAELGVGLIGDIPIFVAHDSADVWSRRELFWLNDEGGALKVAGVPPDYFSKTGQLWGNPLYRWDELKARGFDWWTERFRMTFERFDAIRLDHFIGFYNYWEIPAGSPTAETGRWVPGPGADVFLAARKKLGALPLIAEDLGVVKQGVKDLRDKLGFPGLKVLQMAFGTDPEADAYKPHNYPRNAVVYTGTHDHDTTVGWFNDKGGASSTRTRAEIAREHETILRYLGGGPTDEIHWRMIALALESIADTAIVPMQDLLGLGSEARMNLPGTAEGNWRWRMRAGAFTQRIGERLAQLTAASGRVVR